MTLDFTLGKEVSIKTLFRIIINYYTIVIINIIHRITSNSLYLYNELYKYTTQ